MQTVHRLPITIAKPRLQFRNVVRRGFVADVDIVRPLHQGVVGHLIARSLVLDPLLLQPSFREEVMAFERLLGRLDGGVEHVCHGLVRKQHRCTQPILGSEERKQLRVARRGTVELGWQGNLPIIVRQFARNLSIQPIHESVARANLTNARKIAVHDGLRGAGVAPGQGGKEEPPANGLLE